MLQLDRTDTSSITRALSRNDFSCKDCSQTAQISSRAYLVNDSDGDDVWRVGHQKWLQDPYCPLNNPNGVIRLALAENQLTFDLIQEWLSENVAKALLDEGKADLGIGGLVNYQDFDGLMDLKIAVAGYMSQVMHSSVPFNPSQIVITSGANPAVEILSFCIADPGNAILVPSPYYTGFDKNVKWRSGVELIPVPCRSTDNFYISIAALERAYIKAKKQGTEIRAILISNPNNPVGNIVMKETLCEIVDFATNKNIHLICDEVSAGSTYDGKEFTSVAEFLNTEGFDKSRVHLVYSLSKDLCIPGFRAGVIYSYNENVISAAAKFTRFNSVSVPTQRLLISMLSDKKFSSKFFETNRERIRKMHDSFVAGLKKLGIKCYDSSAGLCCWVDMSKFLTSYSEEGEIELWDKLLRVGKVSMIPGSSFHCIEHGWFRLCFTTLKYDNISVVMERIGRVIKTLN